MEKLKIGIDVDDVLASFVPTFINWHNHTYGTELRSGSFTSYRFGEILKLSAQGTTDRVMEFYDSGDFANMSLVDGAREGIRLLNGRGHNLVAVTARLKVVEESTLSWLGKNFGHDIPEAHFSHNHYAGMGGALTKPEICQQLGIGLIVEDSMDYARQCAEVGIPVVLLDRPWNQGSLPRSVTRVCSWEEITSAVLRL